MTRISKEAARALGLAPKASKYNNEKPTYYDKDLKETLTFDSIKEFEYFLVLKDRQKKGEIFNLRRQVKITIQPDFFDITGKHHEAITYYADFYYITQKWDDDGRFTENKEHYIDVKGVKTDVYRLKKKLLAYKNIIIEEV